MKSFRIALMLVSFFGFACQSPSAGVRDISQEEFVKNPPAGALILDVRTPDEYARGHVPKAILIPHDQLAARIGEIEVDRDAPVVVYCESGKRAGMAGQTLVDAGFSQVLHLDGDMRAWRESGRPTE
jgi:phage shock protein E